MKKAVIFFVVVLILGGCFWIKPESKLVKPNMDLLLANGEATLAKALGGFDVSITTALWTQQVEGIDGGAYNRYYYYYSTNQTNNLWSDLYAGVMKNMDSIITYSSEVNANYYKAVALIMYALALGNTTDLFGDVPYSQAFKAQDPVYDPQQQIYQGIQDMLSQAIAIIDAGNPGDVKLGNGDWIYNWDMKKWEKAAYTLKARYMMHLTKVDSNIDYQQVIQWLDKGISSLDDDMKFVFYLHQMVPPILTYIHKYDGLANNKNFVAYLDSRRDPRINVLNYNGFWASQKAYFPFVQYTEALFLRSEAYWRMGDSTDCKSALKQAVKASLEKYVVFDQQWYDNYCAQVDSMSFDTLIYEIGIQKYIDEMYSPEAYNDWRRLNIPILKPVTGDSIPRRFPYSQIELQRNSNAPKWGAGLNIYTPVWWDGGKD